jgi:hypothetical protein
MNGCVFEQQVRVAPDAVWRHVSLARCVVVGGPEAGFAGLEDVVFYDCVFLYDGMEVDGAEWMSFMTRKLQNAQQRK